MIPITFRSKETVNQFLKRALNQAELNCQSVALKFPDRTFIFKKDDTMDTVRPIVRELYLLMKLNAMGEFSK